MPLPADTLSPFSILDQGFQSFKASVMANTLEALIFSHVLLGLCALLFTLRHFGRKAVYLVDFYSFRPPNHLEGTNAELVHGCKITGVSLLLGPLLLEH